ncbi:phosphatidate cytidylyltransferase [Rhodosalinus halophilus]|uniref:Phosphatidate cytidylyltransferase n=1 Tax=Rhodosalinus halophilus TaxID=2259333 RepID=A0A365U8E1_9RHOB|nr:phosphatidate cytidylyltransferase [Rhodosalinus halophilus]RBI85099.1 phosphatidate cytidylyltransferase [Rhodosalinus halophilus]
MGAGGSKWDDLSVRMATGAGLVAAGAAGIWAGGHVFHALVALICGLMVWELVGMLMPGWRGRIGLGALAGGAVMAAIYLPAGLALPLLLAPAILGFGLIARERALYMGYTVLVVLAGFGMMALRDDFGVIWMLWLVAVVVASDVAGYFAGRMIGGPKFWPRVSPKKTWSGTVAGWLGGAAVGAGVAAVTEAGAGLVGVSVAVAMAAQMGDIAESAIKRHVGVKDSSALLPGHGGLLDRFDGMLGASVFVLIAGQVVDFPPGVAT